MSLYVSASIRHATELWKFGKQNVSVTTTGAHVQYLRNTIGTSEEEIAISTDITGGNDPGYCYLYNAGPTNYVQVGVATGAYCIRLNAGDVAVLPLDAGVTSIFLKANTAPVDVEVLVCER